MASALSERDSSSSRRFHAGRSKHRENLDKRAALAKVGAKLPGLLSAPEREPGMHTSHTLDFVIILAGEVTLELDDGASVDLGTGDGVVQIGARHRWHNRGAGRAVMFSAMAGAQGA